MSSLSPLAQANREFLEKQVSLLTELTTALNDDLGNEENKAEEALTGEEWNALMIGIISTLVMVAKACAENHAKQLPAR